ncbi:phospholipase/carboxylesterase family protein-like protein [Ophiobolus disseminans]|uniref:Phospholipase/carboxylesterase family protein-like protein n=1 Tax=Ophiobolus disseminans TaxID=1469910 RepID=A0A6A6ZT98_9PLEO|nr:phospholipase/carboxylesterase family protein-like protein [Ophiobolus disseminans]
MSTTTTHVVPPTSTHSHTIIFLHGRGSSASTFCSEIFESQDSSGAFFVDIFPSVKWVFPCAPKLCAEVNGEEMHQWFDILSVQRPWEGDEGQKESLKSSAAQILNVIGEESGGIGAENVILAGISQGCATAVYAILAKGARVGGFFGLCGWMPLFADIQDAMRNEMKTRIACEMPVLLQHCMDDEVVPFENGKGLCNRMRAMGIQVKWEVYPEGGHWLNEPEGMDGLVTFVREIMGKHAGIEH